MMKRILALLLAVCVCGVIPTYGKKHQTEEIITTMTQLQKRQYQTKTYKSTDKVVVMKGILNTLQDEGYIVYNVNSLLGFIYGVKDFDTTDPNVDISKEFGLTKSRLNYNGVTVATLEVTVNVTDYGDDLKVRTNFKRKLLNQYGNAQFIDDIEESEFYSEFYEKVDKAIALQKQMKSKIQPIRREIIPVPVPVKPRLEVKQTPLPEEKENVEVKTNNVKPIVDESTIKPKKTIKKEEPPKAEVKEEELPKPEIKKEEVSIQEPLSEKEAAKKEAQEMKEMLKQAKQQAKEEAKLQKEQEKEAKKAAKELMKEE